MDKSQLQKIFSTAYNHENWLEVLKQVFGARQLLMQPKPIELASNDITEGAFELGNITTSDDRIIGLYKIDVKSKVWLERNKVTLRKLLRDVYRYDVDGALIIFVQEKKWRFSFVSEIRTEEGKQETEPKRYTYLFGEGESSRTAAERFDFLVDKTYTIQDLFEAFSVEKLNKDFFKQYKEQYDKFWNYLKNTDSYRELLIDKRFNENEIDKQEKPLRDFTKKLLGRIIFLQFIQKKEWLGCPILKTEKANNEIWEGGNKTFLRDFFENCPEPEFFHSKYLDILFHETLNKRREDNIFSISVINKLSGKLESSRIPYLNGGLFERDKKSTPIDFPVEYFKGLFSFLDQYNFTIYENDPLENAVGIDPEMLGHIFENLLEENKEKGAFYTPKEIVHYMCQESIIEFLCTELDHLPKHDIIQLVRNNIVTSIIGKRENALSINEKLKNIKICDPAIGSGAFPMGILLELFECRQLLYGYLKTNEEFNPAKVKKEIIQKNIYGVDIENGAVDIARLRFWLSLVVDEIKPVPLPNLDFKIIQGNSLLERFEGVDLSQIHKNSSKNGLVGNLFSGQLNSSPEEDFSKLIDVYFELDDPEKKKEIHRKIDDAILSEIHLSIEEHKKYLIDETKKLNNKIKQKSSLLNSAVQKISYESESKDAQLLKSFQFDLDAITEKEVKLNQLYNSTDRPFFLWRIFFKDVFDQGGFDIVIGNPPYIQLQKLTSDLNAYSEAKYDTFIKTGDIYCLFYELGNNILKPNGNLNFITSNKWMNAAYGKNFREFLLKKTNPILLVDFSKTVIFPAAVVFVNILLFKKEKNQNLLKGVKVQSDFQVGRSDLAEYIENNTIEISDLKSDNWTIADKSDFEITKVIDEIGIPLKNWDLKFFRGITSGFNQAFHIDIATKTELISRDNKNSEIIKPLLRGKDIKRWNYSFENLYILNTHNGIREKQLPRIDVERDYPVVYNYLYDFYDENSPKAVITGDGKVQTLKNRADQGDHWTNLRNCAFIEEFEKEKIVWIEISDRANFCLDTDGHYLTNSAYFITGSNLHFLLGVLNSRLMDFYFYQKTAQIAGGRKRYTKQYVELLPIPQITDQEILKKFEIIVFYMTFLNDKDQQPVNQYTDNIKISMVFEDTLNMMVNELYFKEHMTKEEIDVLKYINNETFPPLIEDGYLNAQIIGDAYKRLQEQDNPIRNRIILSNIRSKDIIRRINSTTH